MTFTGLDGYLSCADALTIPSATHASAKPRPTHFMRFLRWSPLPRLCGRILVDCSADIAIETGNRPRDLSLFARLEPIAANLFGGGELLGLKRAWRDAPAVIALMRAHSTHPTA